MDTRLDQVPASHISARAKMKGGDGELINAPCGLLTGNLPGVEARLRGVLSGGVGRGLTLGAQHLDRGAQACRVLDLRSEAEIRL